VLHPRDTSLRHILAPTRPRVARFISSSSAPALALRASPWPQPSLCVVSSRPPQCASQPPPQCRAQRVPHRCGRRHRLRQPSPTHVAIEHKAVVAVPPRAAFFVPPWTRHRRAAGRWGRARWARRAARGARGLVVDHEDDTGDLDGDVVRRTTEEELRGGGSEAAAWMVEKRRRGWRGRG
jgi:hypothetical protein